MAVSCGVAEDMPSSLVERFVRAAVGVWCMGVCMWHVGVENVYVRAVRGALCPAGSMLG